MTVLYHELCCDDCGWRHLVSDLTVTECYIDPLAFHENEHTRGTGGQHRHFTRTRHHQDTTND